MVVSPSPFAMICLVNCVLLCTFAAFGAAVMESFMICCVVCVLLLCLSTFTSWYLWCYVFVGVGA